MAEPTSPGSLTDAQARNFVIKSLRNSRRYYRAADTAGEAVERELDRLIKRKTRISASSLVTVLGLYKTYLVRANAVQSPLADAATAAANF